jgi:protein SCO1
MKSRSAVLLVIAVLVGLAATVAGGIFGRPYAYHGSLIDPPVHAADFKLTDTGGHPYQLTSQAGRTQVIFFGYTNCPDVCPVTLTKFKQIKTELGAQAGKVDFVFITVDPERDNQQQIQQYLSNYDTSFIGLTGTPDVLQQVWKDYGVYVQKGNVSSSGSYEVDHTARIFVIDGAGNWRITYPYEMETESMVKDLQHLLKESS